MCKFTNYLSLEAEIKISETKMTPILNIYIEKIIALKRSVGENLYALGGLLLEIQSQKLYLEQCETFNEFLAIPEISFSRATAYKAMKVFDVFSKYSKQDIIGKCDFDKLYRITSVVDKNVDMWIGKALALSRSDLAREVREAKGLLPEHDDNRTVSEQVKDYLYTFCPKKGIKPEKLELEELLDNFLQWYRKKE